MTQPFNSAGGGQPAGPAPDTTAAGSRTAGGTGPGVPLSIWPGLPAREAPDGLPCGGPVTVAAARRVIDTFSVPGDLVAAVGGCSPAVTEAAAAAGRRVLGLVPDGRSGYPLPVPWTRVIRLRPGGPVRRCRRRGPRRRDGRAGHRRLLRSRLLRQRRPRTASPDAGLLYAACERLLRPGGILAVITAGTAAPGGTTADTAGSVVAAARAAGLVYAQHIVLVHAAIDGDCLDPVRLARPRAAAG